MFSRHYLAIALVLAGCVSVEEMADTPPQRVLRLSQNYQQVYAQTNRGMRNCNTGGLRVDGQLYSELGYGEVTTGGNGLSSEIPFMFAKISREGNGALVELKSMNSLRPEPALHWMEYWAKGGLKCPGLSVSAPPPAI